MAHVAKYTRAQIGAMSRHYERAQKEDGEYHSFGNQDIDVSRIHLNYNLAPGRDGQGQLEFIKQRTSEVKCHNRADVNVMCSWVVTAPKELEEHEHELFFEEVYKFLNDRYFHGSDRNVVSAYVHMDETTPHIHYAFVPVVWDSKKELEKVSAKELVHRHDLKTFHPDLERHMAEVFGREIGILNDATKDGNRSVEELKRGSAQKKLQEELGAVEAEKEQARLELSALRVQLEDVGSDLENLKLEATTENKKYNNLKDQTKSEEKKLNNIKGQINKMQEQIEPMRQNVARLTAVNAEYEAKKKYLDKAKESSDISMKYPDYAKISKKTFGKEEYVTVPKDKWEERHVSANEVLYLKKMQASIERSMDNFTKSQSGVVWHGMREKIISLEKEVEKLSAWSTRDKTTIEDLHEQLAAKDKEREGLIARVNRVLDKIDEGAAQKFVQEWKVEENALKQSQKRRGWDGPEM